VNERDLDAYDYELPRECIAQHPAAERDGARLLVLGRESGRIEHSEVRALPRWLAPGDLLVVNATRVLPARLRGHKESGGAAEALLLGESDKGAGRYRALVRATGRLRTGQKFRFGPECLDAELVHVCGDGEVELAFATDVSPYTVGETPLPPYIRRSAPLDVDADRYQTTFARVPGSVAAPTAGLHLSEALLESLGEGSVDRAEVVLHVGPGTFRPLDARDLSRGRLHAERFELDDDVCQRIAETRARGGLIVAVGTTTARVLESCVDDDGRLRAARGETDLFLAPGSRFRAVDALLTNFHLPRSSLLLLVAAFAGRERILSAYAEAIRSGYRFYSYGDAMLIR
jgi:S-adenosylmethionine:tRNA ribosyltransferase-isomerase